MLATVRISVPADVTPMRHDGTRGLDAGGVSPRDLADHHCRSVGQSAVRVAGVGGRGRFCCVRSAVSIGLRLPLSAPCARLTGDGASNGRRAGDWIRQDQLQLRGLPQYACQPSSAGMACLRSVPSSGEQHCPAGSARWPSAKGMAARSRRSTPRSVSPRRGRGPLRRQERCTKGAEGARNKAAKAI
jgi:hypothetical protein